MARPKRLDLEKITIRIHRGDKERLDFLYPKLGHTEVIRTLIRNHIRRIDEIANQQIPKLNATIDIGTTLHDETNQDDAAGQ